MTKAERTLKYLYRRSLLRFITVGGLGTIVNLAVFFICADLSGIDKNISSIFAFMTAITGNYILNHLWSFNRYIKSPLSFKLFINYLMVNLGGLAVNLIVLNIADYLFNPQYKVSAQFLGIISGTIINYTGSRLFVFRHK